MYAYCMNNPINMHDPTGTSILAIPAGLGIAKAVAAFAGFITGSYIGAQIGEIIKNNKRATNNTVYTLRDKETDEIKYAGMTVNPDTREQNHKNDPVKGQYKFVPEASGLTYEEARGLEQILIIEYSTKELLNKINGISPKNSKLDIYMEAGRAIATYMYDSISDEALYWTGQ